VATASIVAYYLESQRLEPRGERRPAALLPSVFALGIGLSLSNASAVLSGLVRRGGVFVRTPKPRAPRTTAGRRARPRYVAASSPTAALEAAFALYFLLAMLLAARFGMWLALPFLALFLHGYGWVTVLSWRERAGSPTSRTAE
jgi:hypothetical protein